MKRLSLFLARPVTWLAACMLTLTELPLAPLAVVGAVTLSAVQPASAIVPVAPRYGPLGAGGIARRTSRRTSRRVVRRHMYFMPAGYRTIGYGGYNYYYYGGRYYYPYYHGGSPVYVEINIGANGQPEPPPPPSEIEINVH